MTLSTHIRLVDPVPPERVFQFCQSLLGDPEMMLWEHEDGYMPGCKMYHNRVGQGYASMLFVEYHPDGPLPRYEDLERWPDEPDTSPSGCCIDIFLDTTYGYTGPHGGGCADLHAWIITQVVAQFPGAFWWKNENTGEWFDSLDSLDKLGNPEKGALR